MDLTIRKVEHSRKEERSPTAERGRKVEHSHKEERSPMARRGRKVEHNHKAEQSRKAEHSRNRRRDTALSLKRPWQTHITLLILVHVAGSTF